MYLSLLLIISLAILGWGQDQTVKVFMPTPQGQLHRPKITKANSTFLFSTIGKVEPSIITGHLRFSVNLTEIIQMKRNLCQTIDFMHRIIKTTYAGNLPLKSTLQMGSVRKTVRVTPSAAFKLLAFPMLGNLERNCNRIRDRITILEELLQVKLELSDKDYTYDGSKDNSARSSFSHLIGPSTLKLDRKRRQLFMG